MGAFFPFALAAYLALVGVILLAAFRHRRRGWLAGVALAFLLLTLPLWIMLLIAVVTPWLPPPQMDPGWKQTTHPLEHAISSSR